MDAQELRLGLSGRRLDFPDGKAFCLVCGRRPVATRTMSYKDHDYAEKRSAGLNTVLNWVHPALGWVNRMRFESFEIDAPVCLRHVLRGRWIDLALILLCVGGLATVLVLSAKGTIEGKPGALGTTLKAGLVALPLLSGWFAWRFRGRSPLLPCSARREAQDVVVLTYPNGAPRRPT